MARSRQGAVLSLLVLLALAVPASASAKVICVNQSGPDCVDPPGTETTIQNAVNDAANGDTIKIAAGTFHESVNADGKTLTFVGKGDSTVIQGNDSTSSTPALSMAHGGTVRSLRIQGGDKTNPTGTGPAGIRFYSTGDYSLTLDHVTVVGGGAPGGGANGGSGVDMQNGGTPGNDTRLRVTSSTLNGNDGSGPATGNGLVSTAAGGRIAVADSTLAGLPSVGGGGAGADIENGGTATMLHSSFSGRSGIVINSATVTAVRSRVAGVSKYSSDFASGLLVLTGTATPARATIVDSLVTATPAPASSGAPSTAAFVGSSSASASLAARGSTFYAQKAMNGAVMTQRGASYPAVAATLRNSIARSVTGESGSGDLRADGGTISADYSSFSTRAVTNSGSATAPGAGHNIAGDPKLASNLSLLSSSPLIERGDRSIVTPGELDLAGAPRALDANHDCAVIPDIGAFERPGGRGCPAPGGGQAAVSPTVSSFGATNKVFAPVSRGGKITAVDSRRKRRVKRGTRFRYRLSEAGKVRIAIERKLKGRKVKRKGKKARCVAPKRKYRKKRRCTRYKRVTTLKATKKAGRQSTPFTGRVKGKALKPGRYRATIVVTNAAGKKSRARRLNLKIVKAR